MPAPEPERLQRLEELFNGALHLAPDEQATFLERACGGDEELRREVERLLAASGKADGVFEPLSPDDGSWVDASAPLPARIGRYEIRRVIASGGMGTVYEALQENPRRTVALKVMRHLIVGPETRRRFEREKELLGKLTHPGIAQVYDAGTHDDGGVAVPYFAMEFVPGARPITDYADAEGLDLRARLELFTQVCDAVNHGHREGIVHRDLKPSNILVGADGRTRVIDFGIARAADSDLATSVRTQTGELVGTLQYMSPEQCEAEPSKVGVRSDVYSLGVILYELLAGRLPYNVSGMPLPEATRIIRDDEPPSLGTVDPRLRGDLEIIVGKALEKHRHRRYASAAELGDDVRRYLAVEPIRAHPPSAVYRLSVYTRRHRLRLGMATVLVVAVVLAVLGGTVVALVLFGAGLAFAAFGWWMTSLGREAAEKAQSEAAAEARKARATLEFLDEMFRTVDPYRTPSPEVTVRSMIDEAGERIEASALVDQPEVTASVRMTLGETYYSLGHYADAVRHLEAALEIRQRLFGSEHPDVAASLNSLAKVLHHSGQHARARSLFERALATRRKLLGDEHPAVIETLHDLAKLLFIDDKGAEAEALLLEGLSLARTVHGPDHLEVAAILTRLANVVRGRPEGLDYCREALRIQRRHLGDEHLDVAETLTILGANLCARNRRAEGLALFDQGLEMRRKFLGENHRLIGLSLFDCGGVLLMMGRLEESEHRLRESVEVFRRTLGEGHWEVARSRSWLGDCLKNQDRYEEAERELLAAHPVMVATLGERHPRVLNQTTWLLEVYERWDQPGQREHWLPEAEALLQGVVDGGLDTHGNDPGLPAVFLSRLGLCHALMGRGEESERELLESERVLSGLRRKDRIAWVRQRLATLYDRWGKPEKAALWRATLRESALEATPTLATRWRS